MPLENTLQLKEVAKILNNTTGADIEAICRESALIAVKNSQKNITMDNFLQAFDKIKKEEEIENSQRIYN